jgi:hypothetical protein
MNGARQQHPLADPIAEATGDSPVDTFASVIATAFENIIAVPLAARSSIATHST